MFCTCTGVLILSPEGHSDGLQDVGGLGREPGTWTIGKEVIMATIATATKLRCTDRRRSRNTRDDWGRHTPPNGGVLLGQTLENMNATPREKVSRRIASLPDTRQDKVLDIRRRIAEGTYEVAYRLDKAVDRVLEAITT